MSVAGEQGKVEMTRAQFEAKAWGALARLDQWKDTLLHLEEPDYVQISTGKPYSEAYVRRRIAEFQKAMDYLYSPAVVIVEDERC